MNKALRGSISLLLLLGCCFFTLLTSLLAQMLVKEYEQQVSQLHLLQLRQLAGTALVHQVSRPHPAPGTELLAQVSLAPGNIPATLTCSYSAGPDGSFSCYSTKAETADQTSCFQQLKFNPSEELEQLAENYGIVASYGITNAQYLPSGTLYTSNGSFHIPDLDLLAQYGYTSLDLEDLHNNGSNGNFVMINNLNSQTRLTYNAAMPHTKGPLLLASRGNILVEKNFHAPDRLILITDRGTITLEDNVTLDAALIISGGRLTIGKNCRLTGIFMAQDRISLQGKSIITQAASVVAPLAAPITSFVE